MTDFDLKTNEIPTPIARVAARLKAEGTESSGDTFLLTSYLFEVSLKIISLVLLSGLRISTPENAYAIAYKLVRAEGLGAWEDAIQKMSSQPLAGYLHAAFQPLQNWLTQKRKLPSDEWFYNAIKSSDQIISTLGVDYKYDDRKPRNIGHLLKSLVLIRNKTKAHGAVGPDFFQSANPDYFGAVKTIVTRCPIFKSQWLHLSWRMGKNTVRGISLQGSEPSRIRDADCEQFSPRDHGIYVIIGKGALPLYVGEFIKTTLECQQFHLPNGSFSTNNSAEFIDYASGSIAKYDLSQYSMPPAPLPPSETQGLDDLDIQSNVFGNLPPPPKFFVNRPQLERALKTRLLDKNHPIITLHGRGGIGKTSLALWAAHELSLQDKPTFSSIVWFSARDVDLLPTGPRPVRAAVIDLTSVAKVYSAMFGSDPTEEGFAKALQTPDSGGAGKLFIFDNFETFSDSRQLHKFLDTHTHLPNKILMTSRERAFKADYPIEVRGMETDEAKILCRSAGRDLGIEGILTETIIESIYQYTDGHPYVMRLVIGEIAKEHRYIPPKDLLPKRIDIVNAVFERSFNKLSTHGKWVYLLTTNWRTAISELALVVVCAERDIDAEAGAEECLRLSLLNSEVAPDESHYYWAPELARIFGRKKLDSDPDRLALQEALQSLRRFSVLKPGQVEITSRTDVVKRFLSTSLAQAKDMDSKEISRTNLILERIAELYPPAWRQVAEFRIQLHFPSQEIEYSLRRLVEEQPFDKDAWILRAEFAKNIKDDGTYIASLVSAVDADPRDLALLRNVALALCQFIDAHKGDIPRTRRGVYIAGVRRHMENLAKELDATSLSRLAWLFLLEENKQKALHYAQLGLEKESYNEHCKKIVQRLCSERR